MPPQHPDFVMQSFSGTGLVVLLNWMTHPGMQQHHDHKLLPPSPSYCDFNRERGKVRCEYSLHGYLCIFDPALLDLEVAIAKNVVYFHRNE